MPWNKIKQRKGYKEFGSGRSCNLCMLENSLVIPFKEMGGEEYFQQRKQKVEISRDESMSGTC